MGLMSVAKIEASTFPTKASATKQYIVVIRNNEIIMVSGRFLDGFVISPAMAAIFVTPAYEIYRNATPAINPLVPSEKTGSVSFVSKEVRPRAIITINEIILVETINNCVFSTFFRPNTFNKKISKSARRAMALV